MPREGWSSPSVPNRQAQTTWASPILPLTSLGAGPWAAGLGWVPRGPSFVVLLRVAARGRDLSVVCPRPAPASRSLPEALGACGEGPGALIAHPLLEDARPCGAGIWGSLWLIGQVASPGGRDAWVARGPSERAEKIPLTPPAWFPAILDVASWAVFSVRVETREKKVPGVSLWQPAGLRDHLGSAHLPDGGGQASMGTRRAARGPVC